MSLSYLTAHNIITETIDDPLHTQTQTGDVLKSFALGNYTISSLTSAPNHLDAVYRFFERESNDRQDIFYETFGMSSEPNDVAKEFFEKNGKFNIYALWEGHEIRGVITRFYADISNPEKTMRLSPFASSSIKGTGVMGEYYKALAQTIEHVEGISLGFGITAEINRGMRKIFESCGLHQQWEFQPPLVSEHLDLDITHVVYGINIPAVT